MGFFCAKVRRLQWPVAVPHSCNVTVNLCVVVVVDVVTHVSSMWMGYAAQCCSMCSLAAVATSPSMNVYSSVTVDFSANVSNRSGWRCFLLIPVRVVTSCPVIFLKQIADIHTKPKTVYQTTSDCDHEGMIQ